jgi:hypothetical protein
MRTNVRRRHRTWIFSMCMATLGWAVWWITLVVAHFLVGRRDGLAALELARRRVRGGRSCRGDLGHSREARVDPLMLIPMFANASLLAMPLVLKSLRFFDSGVHAPRADAAVVALRVSSRSASRAGS